MHGNFQASRMCHDVVSGALHDVPSACCIARLQVRAANLQELVYKQGSAGITKATVSIVFHNNDPANGPSGYEDKEYITVTRQVSTQAASLLEQQDQQQQQQQRRQPQQ
eukprot:GHRQ01036647.1.p1 GENE.GHRQ01036647.1~~GHRQ01036647.1.p1  ORF type:complete len:109 (+),score=42.81 GHRQ01036647.1:84-410(+)